MGVTVIVVAIGGSFGVRILNSVEKGDSRLDRWFGGLMKVRRRGKTVSKTELTATVSRTLVRASIAAASSMRAARTAFCKSVEGRCDSLLFAMAPVDETSALVGWEHWRKKLILFFDSLVDSKKLSGEPNHFVTKYSSLTDVEQNRQMVAMVLLCVHVYTSSLFGSLLQ